MWRHVRLVRNDVSEERVSSILRVEKISEQREEFFARGFFSTQKMEETLSS
jgi:hypothetical protein